jgi:hypothetical protein
MLKRGKEKEEVASVSSAHICTRTFHNCMTIEHNGRERAEEMMRREVKCCQLYMAIKTIGYHFHQASRLHSEELISSIIISSMIYV